MTLPEDAASRSAEAALSQLEVKREELEDGRYILYFSWLANDDAGVPDTQSSSDDV